MRSILRKLRGVLGTALTWAVAWMVGGFALLTFVYVVGPGLDGLPFWEVAPVLAFRSGVWGLISGGLFSGVLATIHRRHKLGDLSPLWMGLWGALAGLLIPSGVLGLVVASGAISLSPEIVGSQLFIFGGLGVGTAVGTIMLAQVGEKEIESSDPRAAIEDPWI